MGKWREAPSRSHEPRVGSTEPPGQQCETWGHVCSLNPGDFSFPYPSFKNAEFTPVMSAKPSNSVEQQLYLTCFILYFIQILFTYNFQD